MKVGELKKILNRVDDDFDVDITIKQRIPDEELVKMSYPYPWYSDEAVIEFHDIGYSDKEICFGVYYKGEEDD